MPHTLSHVNASERIVAVLAAVVLTAISSQAFRDREERRDTTPPAGPRLTLPEQSTAAEPNLDHELPLPPAHHFNSADAVVEGVVEDFDILRMRDSSEIPIAVRKSDQAIRIGDHHARWNVRVTKALKGRPPRLVRVTSHDFSVIEQNDYRNPYVVGSRHRFYLIGSGLGEPFYQATLVTSVGSATPSPRSCVAAAAPDPATPFPASSDSGTYARPRAFLCSVESGLVEGEGGLGCWEGTKGEILCADGGVGTPRSAVQVKAGELVRIAWDRADSPDTLSISRMRLEGAFQEHEVPADPQNPTSFRASFERGTYRLEVVSWWDQGDVIHAFRIRVS